MKVIQSMFAAAAVALASAANATVILPGGETSLQQVINGLYRSTDCPKCAEVALAPNVNTDQHALDGLWSIEASGISAATVIIEIAGNASTNTFGIYDAVNGNTVQLFGGPADQADQALVSVSQTGQVSTVYLQRDAFGGFQAISWWSSGAGYFTSSMFGYYLGTGGGTFYSQAELNPDGSDQMVAFRGDGDRIKLPGNESGLWGSSSYILAWEDLRYNSSDRDFNDFVVYVESVTGVPEPGTLAILSLGLVGIGLFARRRTR